MDSNTLANLNELFDKRHALVENTIDAAAYANEVTFQEEDNDGHRQFVNLTKKAYDFTESIAPTPARAKGTTKFTLISDFVESIVAAANMQNPKQSPIVEVHAAPKATPHSNFAKVTYNATTHKGDLGHGDWAGWLCAQPEPNGQAWVDALGKELTFADFAVLVYAAGNAVIDQANWPAQVQKLGARLKLDLATSLGDLLALENGFEGTGEFEESVTLNPHTGDTKQVAARKNKPQVRVPTGFMFYYEPFANYGKAVLVRLAYRIKDGVAHFRLYPINLDHVLIELADNLKEDLENTLATHSVDVPVYKTI